jgi:PAS domain S-box-containing protein
VKVLFVTALDQPELQAEGERVVELEREVAGLRRNGTRLLFKITASAIVVVDGGLQYIFCVVADITEQREAQARLGSEYGVRS